MEIVIYVIFIGICFIVYLLGTDNSKTPKDNASQADEPTSGPYTVQAVVNPEAGRQEQAEPGEELDEEDEDSIDPDDGDLDDDDENDGITDEELLIMGMLNRVGIFDDRNDL